MYPEKLSPMGSTDMLLMKLLEETDMYGYQIIEALRERSDHTFDLKAGTIYPILHKMEMDGFVVSFTKSEDNARFRKYYHLTSTGRAKLKEKENRWWAYIGAVNHVLRGGMPSV